MRGDTYNGDLTIKPLGIDIVRKQNNKDLALICSIYSNIKSVQTFYPSTSSIENALTKYID